MTNARPTPRGTIVLIHGLRMTPRIWEHWIDRYERRGHSVIAPAYPGFEVKVEALREDPSPIEAVSVSVTSGDPVPVDVAPLVVGFDGSTPATAALRWAAGTGMPVIIVRVVDPRLRPPGVAHRDDDLRVDDAARVLGDHAAAASRRLAESAWRAELVEACSPAAGLVAAAHHHGASAIVVGSHGHGGGPTILGNQLHELLANADAPVVVVPAQAAARLLGSGDSCAVTKIAC